MGKKLIIDEVGHSPYDFISQYVDMESNILVQKNTDEFNIKALENEQLLGIININKLNDIKSLNAFFITVHEKLETDGLFIGLFESKNERKKRLFRKFPPFINFIYYSFDFLFKRVLAKFSLTKWLVFFITAGRNKVLPKAEILGRLVFCGFEIVDDTEFRNVQYFVCRKKNRPHPKNLRPRYGLLFQMNRIGRYGQIIPVYKLRTMHRYAEYIQDYIYLKNNLEKGGKFKNDYRITEWGHILRIFWIDEIPMLYNLIKGDIKLVGVRPISSHYQELYSKKHNDLRRTYKPGLVPPFYADLPNTIQEIMESEKRYLLSYSSSPFKTDTRYFFQAIQNILFNHARSS
ncbi:MAG: sugar transferase [Flavobacteriales bacterium]|jgi:lipopolysaccharide/colanic/teichoic acid biosynthesis glycosyltransferase|nr:sugar transferase [Flavobacteriales bacterium]